MAELKFEAWLKAEVTRLNKQLSKGPQSGYPEMYTKCETLELVLRRWNRRTPTATTEGCEVCRSPLSREHGEGHICEGGAYLCDRCYDAAMREIRGVNMEANDGGESDT